VWFTKNVIIWVGADEGDGLITYSKSYLNGCFTVCIGKWVLSWFFQVNDWLHTSEINGRSPLCILWCLFRLQWILNVLFTHYNNMAAPQYEYDDESSDYAAHWMIYYTQHRCMVGPLYGYVDVSSEYPGHWMTYYTHYRCMASPQYVDVEVSSDDSGDWMNYYTHYRCTVGPLYGYVDDSSENSAN
jgi:hypothetical protein